MSQRGPGASCTAACIPPRSSQPPASAPAPPSVTAANSRSGLQRHELPSTGDSWPADRHGFPGSAGTHAAALECQGRAGGRQGRRRRPGASPERAITSRWPQRPIKRVAASHLLASAPARGSWSATSTVPDGGRFRVPGNGLWPGQKQGTPVEVAGQFKLSRAHTGRAAACVAATASTTREGFSRARVGVKGRPAASLRGGLRPALTRPWFSGPAPRWRNARGRGMSPGWRLCGGNHGAHPRPAG